MKSTPVSPSANRRHAGATTEGDRSTRNAGSWGLRNTDGGGTNIYPVRVQNFIGADVRRVSHAEVDIFIGGTGIGLPNDDGDTLAYGAVVVVDAAGNLVTTTTPQDTRPVGIVQRSTDDTLTAPAIFSGYVSQVNTTGTVNAGDYLETSGTAGVAQSSGTTRRVGTFGRALTAGPNPSAIIWMPDTITGTGSGGVAPVDYVEKTTPTSITATTEATADVIVTGNSLTWDGATAATIEFGCPYVTPNASAGNYVAIVLFEDGSPIGYMALVRTPASAAMDIPVYCNRRFVPSAGAHTYSVRAHVNAGTGNVAGGAGGVATDAPTFLKIS